MSFSVYKKNFIIFLNQRKMYSWAFVEVECVDCYRTQRATETRAAGTRSARCIQRLFKKERGSRNEANTQASSGRTVGREGLGDKVGSRILLSRYIRGSCPSGFEVP